jgi:aryl-alcohol dehydrogenase-like predicted oxidoreductase
MFMEPVAQRRLGLSPIRLSAIGLGTAQFSAGHGMSGRYGPALPQDVVHEVVYTALRGGINWFDTAEYYGEGASEACLADALYSAGKEPGDVILASKWWPVLRGANSMKVSLAKSLRQLQGFPVDLYQVHQPYSRSTIGAQMKVMADLQASGHVRAVGVCNFSARGMRAAHRALGKYDLALAANQVHYSLLNRRIESNGVLALAKRLNISIIAWSPLEQGLLTGKFHREPAALARVSPLRRRLSGLGPRRLEASRPLVEALETIAARHDATPAQVALNWLVNFHGDTVLAIPGASRSGQVRDNLGALDLQLKPAEFSAIDELSRRFM